MVTGISITDAGIGYTNAPTIRIGAPPAAVVNAASAFAPGVAPPYHYVTTHEDAED